MSIPWFVPSPEQTGALVVCHHPNACYWSALHCNWCQICEPDGAWRCRACGHVAPVVPARVYGLCGCGYAVRWPGDRVRA